MFLRGLLIWLGWLVAATACLGVVLILWALWAYRDIPVEQLEARYGAGVQVAAIDGVDVRYRLEGPADAPVLVLIHSHFMDMGMWDGWLPVLAPNFRVLRYDLTGHGLTGPDPSGNYTVAHDVKMLEQLLQQLGLNRVALAGSSLGGNIAFTFAAQHPEQVSALVLVNSGGFRSPNSRGGDTVPDWLDWLLPLVPPKALHKFLGWMAADDSVLTDELKTRFVELLRREGNRHAEFQRLQQFETGNPDALLASITAPTLILWGEDNPQLPLAQSELFAQKLVGASLVVRMSYAGAGHLLPLERPEQSAKDAFEFLRFAQLPAGAK